MSAAADEFRQIRDGNLSRDGKPVAEIIPKGEAEFGTGFG